MVLSYKIRNKQTGLFSTGGYHPQWTKKGKTWARYSDMKSHLSQFKKGMYLYVKGDEDIYDNCEVVEYELVEKVCVDITNIDALSAKGRKKGLPLKRGRIENVVDDVTSGEPLVHRKLCGKESFCGAKDNPKGERIILSVDAPLVTCPECITSMRKRDES